MSLSQHYTRESKPTVSGPDSTCLDKSVTFNKEVGNLLQKARVSTGLSQQQAGDKMRLSQDSISKHENGAPVSAYRLLEFARIYEKPVSFFYMGGLHGSR